MSNRRARAARKKLEIERRMREGQKRHIQRCTLKEEVNCRCYARITKKTFIERLMHWMIGAKQ